MEAALAAYLASVFAGPVEVLGLRPLGGPDAEGRDPKGFGYGVPFEVECVVSGTVRSLVVARTRAVAGLRPRLPGGPGVAGPLRPPRLQQLSRLTSAASTWASCSESGALVSAGDATEFFQLVEKAEGAALLARSRPAADRAPAAPRRRPGAGARRLPRARARGQARRAHALRAPHPRAGGARRVPDGDPRQLSASLPAAAAARLRGARARRGLVAVAAARARPPAGAACTAISIPGTSCSATAPTSRRWTGAAGSGASRPTT